MTPGEEDEASGGTKTNPFVRDAATPPPRASPAPGLTLFIPFPMVSV